MYRKAEFAPLPPLDFELANGSKLSALNRWVKMAQIIPWSEFESEYAANFRADKGAPAKSFRMALGALIIKEKLGISDPWNRRTDPGKPLSAILYRSIKLQ